MWDLSSLFKVERGGSLNHWTAREVLQGRVFKGNSWGDSCRVNLSSDWFSGEGNRVGLQESQASASSCDDSLGVSPC